MKLSVAALLTLTMTASASAQVLSADGVTRIQSGGAQVFSASRPASQRVSYWTSTLPVAFSRLEKVDDKWQLGANMSVGGSYVFVTGKGTPQPDGSVRLDPEFMIGPVANLGVTPGSEGGLDGTLMIGGTMGFSNFAVLWGYDVLQGRAVIGVGMQIQTLTFTEALTKRLRTR